MNKLNKNKMESELEMNPRWKETRTGKFIPCCAVCGKERKQDSWTAERISQDSKYFTKNVYLCSSHMNSKAAETQQAPAVIYNTPAPQPVILEAPQPVTVSINDADMSKYIPKTDGYIPQELEDGMLDTELFKKIYDRRAQGIKKGLAIEGLTGCGKTHFVRSFCFHNRLPYCRVNCNGMTTPADLKGQFIPNSDGTGFKWVDGKLTQFMRYGGIFVVDEINMGAPDVLAILNPILDNEQILVLTERDSEIIHAHPDFFLVSTYNPDYEGTKPLNAALKDRFLLLRKDYNTAAEKQLIKGIKGLHDFAEKVRAMTAKGELASPLSTRTLLCYQQDRELFGEKRARINLYESFTAAEKPIIKEALELHLGEVA